MPTSDADQQPERRSDGQAFLAGVALLAILGFAWALRDCGRESDRHALMRQVREIEARIRIQGPGLCLLVEGDDSPQHPDPVLEKTHQAILRDFERLAHLDHFAMTNVDVQVNGDQARVSYRIRGAPHAGDELPSGGLMRFTRRATKWRLAEHHLIEESQPRWSP